MGFYSRLLFPVLLIVPAVFAQSIIQPGAPGQPSKTLNAKSVRGMARPPLPADIAFMQGMIHHHAQAVEMVGLLRTRGKSPALKAFGERIAISQTDEIKFMKQWLEAHGQSSSMQHDHMNMKGMNHDMSKMNGSSQLDSMADMPPMPGMLTAAQMKALAAAKGAQFDHLFLTGMIQHHTGALTMVDDLYSTPATAQDPVLFDFVTDIVATQSAEIKIMQHMLEETK